MNPKFVSAFLAALVALAIGVALLFSQQCSKSGDQENLTVTGPATSEGSSGAGENADPAVDNPPTTKLDESPIDPTPVEKSYSTPEELLTEIGQALENDDAALIERLLSQAELTPDAQALLADYRGTMRLDRPGHISRVGELERNQSARYALQFADQSKLYFDIKRGEDGSYFIDALPTPKVDPTTGRAVFVDSLGISDAFLQSALSLNFEEARAFVDREGVSDAKIAGLCILFEEGGYELDSEHPLRAMFTREQAAGFVANLVTGDDAAAGKAQFGINAKKDANGAWIVSEIALDKLLSDYASRIAEGDVHYSPIVANPEGGETIVIYFEFDAGELTPRTARQLEIVATLLRTDPEKKIRLTGHTDTLGSDDYNRGLSASRAETVKAYLIEQGVGADQISINAAGESNPRRPEVTGDGEDDPSGRRANRRTEVYLDF